MQIQKPWGSVKEYALNQTATVRIIYLEANQETSLHSHNLRDDMWVILDKNVKVQIGDEIKETKPGDEYFIPAETLHRILSGDTPARVLEIAFGYASEEDIARVADDYGRIIED
ncbi:MAG: cupin domain-containing protein [Actinobacteria bacterium]|nr:MAG: cupin domain-containing protein [Actinomycetota bacterium]